MNIQQKAKYLLNQHSADYADANTNIHFAGALAAIEAALSQSIEPQGAVVGEIDADAWYESGQCDTIGYVSTDKASVQKYIDARNAERPGCSPSLLRTGPYPLFTYDTVHDLEVELTCARSELAALPVAVGAGEERE